MPRTDEANQQIRDDRRDRILETAAILIQDQGLAAVKITDLAAAAGMSQGLFYRYFDDKEDLFLALVDREASSIQAVYDAAARVEGPAATRLRALLEGMIASVVQNPRRHHTIVLGLTHPGRTSQVVQDLKARMVGDLTALIAGAQAEGAVGPDRPQTLAVLVLATLQGLGAALSHYADPDLGVPTADQVFRLLGAPVPGSPIPRP